MTKAATTRHRCHRCKHTLDTTQLYRTSFDEHRDPANRDAAYLARPTSKYPQVWLCYPCMDALIKAGQSYAF